MKFIGRKALALAGAGMLASLALATPALAQPNTACQADGLGAFTPNGSSFAWTLSASLTNCQSSVGVTGGTLGVGETLTESVPITLDTGEVVQGTAQYLEPAGKAVPQSNAFSICDSANTPVQAVVSWDDGSVTIVSLSGASIGPAWELSGSVGTSLRLTLVPGSANPAGTAPAFYTLLSNSTTFPVGTSVAAVVAISPDDPETCNGTPASFGSFSASGAVELG